MRNKMMKPHQEAKMMGYQDGGAVSPGRPQRVAGPGPQNPQQIRPQAISEPNRQQAQLFANRLAEAMDKPRGDVTGMDGDRMDRMMGVNRGRMSSGGRRPAMRKNRLV